MKIGIHCWGSEGDVRPFLALADALVAAGHEVRLAYCPADGRDYSARLAAARYEHTRLDLPQSREELRRIGSEVFADPFMMRQLSRVFRNFLEPMAEAMARSGSELAKWADVLVLHCFALPLAAAAEKEHKPFVSVHLAPLIPTRAFPGDGWLPDLGVVNKLAWKVAEVLISKQLIVFLNQSRAGLGLAPVKRTWQQLESSAIDLVAVSPTLLPRPNDWREKVQVSGCWSAPPEPCNEQLDAQIEAFLADGPPPVYVTFGSMTALEKDPGMLIGQVEQALATAGCRAIVQAETPGRPSPHVLRVSATVHDQVFPRCSAIVHHGGAGTTHAALRAGRPSVVVPHISDQFMWARQLQRLGVAPAYLWRYRLQTPRLVRAIQQVSTDAAMRATAERLGQQMRSENGLRRAVELITSLGSSAR